MGNENAKTTKIKLKSTSDSTSWVAQPNGHTYRDLFDNSFFLFQTLSTYGLNFFTWNPFGVCFA